MAAKKIRSRAQIEQAIALALDRLNHVTMPQYAKTSLYARIQALEWVLGDDEYGDIILPKD